MSTPFTNFTYAPPPTAIYLKHFHTTRVTFGYRWCGARWDERQKLHKNSLLSHRFSVQHQRHHLTKVLLCPSMERARTSKVYIFVSRRYSYSNRYSKATSAFLLHNSSLREYSSLSYPPKRYQLITSSKLPQRGIKTMIIIVPKECMSPKPLLAFITPSRNPLVSCRRHLSRETPFVAPSQVTQAYTPTPMYHRH